jgi:hypothetical protein
LNSRRLGLAVCQPGRRQKAEGATGKAKAATHLVGKESL